MRHGRSAPRRGRDRSSPRVRRGLHRAPSGGPGWHPSWRAPGYGTPPGPARRPPSTGPAEPLAEPFGCSPLSCRLSSSDAERHERRRGADGEALRLRFEAVLTHELSGLHPCVAGLFGRRIRVPGQVEELDHPRLDRLRVRGRLRRCRRLGLWRGLLRGLRLRRRRRLWRRRARLAGEGRPPAVEGLLSLFFGVLGLLGPPESFLPSLKSDGRRRGRDRASGGRHGLQPCRQRCRRGRRNEHAARPAALLLWRPHEQRRLPPRR